MVICKMIYCKRLIAPLFVITSSCALAANVANETPQTTLQLTVNVKGDALVPSETNVILRGQPFRKLTASSPCSWAQGKSSKLNKLEPGGPYKFTYTLPTECLNDKNQGGIILDAQDAKNKYQCGYLFSGHALASPNLFTPDPLPQSCTVTGAAPNYTVTIGS